MGKKRVLIFSLAPFTALGGAEIAISEIIRRLPGIEFDVVSAGTRSGIWQKYTFPLVGYREALRRREQQKYDLTWAIMANQAGMAGAYFKKKHPEIPFLLTLQEGDELGSLAYRARLLGPRLFRVFQQPDHITAISNYLATWARAMGARCPIEVVPNGVDLNSFQLLASSFQKSPGNAKTIITTSRLVYKNGVDMLIKALKYLPQEVRLVILGDGPEREKLKLITKTYQLEPRVKFSGSVPYAELPKHLATADVFCRPSRSEGLGNSFLEAMAVGLPVIGTSIGGIPDFLTEGETGWFCRPDDPKNIAQKVAFVLDPANQVEVARVVKNARHLVEERYSWDRVAVAMEKVFNQMTA